MSSNIIIRRAAIDEMSWINERYQEVGFKLSEWEQEWITIAQVNGVQKLRTVDRFHKRSMTKQVGVMPPTNIVLDY